MRRPATWKCQPRRQVFSFGEGERIQRDWGPLYYSMKEVLDTCIDSGLGETHQRTKQPYWEEDDRAGAGRTRPVNASHVEKATGLRYEIKVTS
jgi:hypothetical protein